LPSLSSRPVSLTTLLVLWTYCLFALQHDHSTHGGQRSSIVEWLVLRRFRGHPRTRGTMCSRDRNWHAGPCNHQPLLIRHAHGKSCAAHIEVNCLAYKWKLDLLTIRTKIETEDGIYAPSCHQGNRRKPLCGSGPLRMH
jgi:hypothetical protein